MSIPSVFYSPAALGSRFQIEHSGAGFLVANSLGDRLTAPGVGAVIAALDTYYNSTITPTQRAALSVNTGFNYVSIQAGKVFAAVAPGTEQTLAGSLATVLKTAGNTVGG